VAFDDASGVAENAVCAGAFEIVDGAGMHPAPEAMLRPVMAHLEELAARHGGVLSTAGPARIAVAFRGDGRAARSAFAFARRAGALALRAHRDLRLRAGIGAHASSGPNDVVARDEAERAMGRAKPGTLLVTEAARRLAAVAHRFGPLITIPADPAARSSGPNSNDALAVQELPLAPRIAGRAGERIVIEQAIAAADVGKAQQVLFLGAAGIGKTALLQIAEAEARDRGFVVARARCAASRGLRYDAVRQAIRSVCRELISVGGTTAPWHEALGPLGVREPDRKRLRALVDDEPHDDIDVPLSRRRVILRAAILGFFAALAEKRGVCVIVDDVHRGDASSLEVFAEVGARLHGARFAVFAAGRPMQGERVLPLAKRSVLEVLDNKDVAHTAALAIGGVLPDAAADKIANKARGAPLYAALAARHLVATQLLAVTPGEVTASIDLDKYPLPGSVEVLLFAMHALLTPAARELLVACAQAGGAIGLTDAAAMLGAEAGAALAECVDKGFLVDVVGDGDGNARYAFATASERDIVAARADRASSQGWHARLADNLTARAQASGRRGPLLEERLVQHRTLADDSIRAAEASESAAEAWARMGAPDASAEHYKRALHGMWKVVSGAGSSVDEKRASHALDLAARATR
ncbi:MAG TPA: BREX system ATP-binding domain-containing protein, partial [Myxococcota bacterium]